MNTVRVLSTYEGMYKSIGPRIADTVAVQNTSTVLPYVRTKYRETESSYPLRRAISVSYLFNGQMRLYLSFRGLALLQHCHQTTTATYDDRRERWHVVG